MKKEIIHKKCNKKIENCKCKNTEVKFVNKDYSAKLTIYGLPEFDRNRVKRTAEWLQRIAKEILKEKDLKIYTNNPIFKLWNDL